MFNGVRYKKVFEAEDTQWKKADERYQAAKKEGLPDLTHLLQPIRLEKLLSRDEQYIIDFPSSMKTIVDSYIQDLVVEGEVENTPENILLTRRALGGDLYKFIKEQVQK
jgi:hypothetical protein